MTASGVCAAAVAAALAGSPAAAQTGSGVVQSGPQVLASPAEISDYWTAKRLRNAKPLGVPRVPGAPDDDGSGSSPQGAPVEIPARTLAPQEDSGPLSQEGGAGAFELSDTLSYPNRVHGKVFFTKPGIGNYVCSGSVVNAANDSTVITAGHCVNDSGVWSTNFAFVPGYHRVSGVVQTPFGVWAGTNLLAPQQWVPSENFHYDVGAAVIARNSIGLELEDVVGARGIAFNQDTSLLTYRSHGYPAQMPNPPLKQFDGYRLWACDSTITTSDNPPGSGPPTQGIACDMTGGSSGGGWVYTDASDSYVNSVNSYKYLNQPDLMFGPYFGTDAEAVFNQAQNQEPGTPQSGNASPAAAQPVATTLKQKRKCKKPKKRGKKKRCKRVKG